ncbi:MAG: valine--tRNA ligase [Nitrospira sp.]|nr:MAG: valine--tRNA ligase [Nitrospira sp.]
MRAAWLDSNASMTTPQLDKTYDPKTVEARWYQTWDERGYFHASPSHPGRPYCIVIPPPNVTGSLHLGHALNNSLQDILIRWRRMQGRNVLWMPGTDHAGIATQNVVERQLTAEGSSREQLGRDKFIERVWAWKTQSGGTIVQQLKRLGASCDWERERFTMDQGLSKAVRKVFIDLFHDTDKLLYRGERLINWCPRCLTALSDIEVEHEDVTGKLYTIRYLLTHDPSRHLLVATTRPETLLGDTAVAVHPDDNRYNHLIGKRVNLPLTTRSIQIVGDPILVDREFGTGAVKITPAHDFNDFEAGERHGLRRINILDTHARMATGTLQLQAQAEKDVLDSIGRLPVVKARPKVEELLAARGLLEKVEPHKMALGKCYRCKTVVEPFLSTQWFVRIKPLAGPAIEAVETGRIKIIPEGWKNNYLGWMRDIKDWCVSRQIWWGHQIPAWYCRKCYQEDELNKTIPNDKWQIPPDAPPIVPREGPPVCPNCGNKDLIQDPDVLDTWFSSGLWPFSTLGWPEQTAELQTYYPTSTLVTGLDILFFWVARMIMLGLKFMGDVPFREVYIHALVRDAEGQKMSKSKGNVMDPLHVMDQFGTDALRFTLASMASPGRDIKLAEERIEGYRNFANKIWNAARFAHMYLAGTKESCSPVERPFPDRWIMSRLNQTIQTVTIELDAYRFDRASYALYQFFWHEYCDWYLELIKPVLQDPAHPQGPVTRQTLQETLEVWLRLLHPFMPFITEEIWQTFPHTGDTIVTQPYPIILPAWHDTSAENTFLVFEQSIGLMRTARVLLNYPPGKEVRFFVTHEESATIATLTALERDLAHLGRGQISLAPVSRWPTSKVLRLVAGGVIVGVSVEGDVNLKKALDRLVKQIAETDKESQRLDGKLKSADFVSKAPPEVITDHHDRLRALARDRAMLASSEQQLRTMLGA